MRIVVCILGALLLAATAGAAPNVTNATQKGSLLVFPDIRANDPDGWNTLVRIQNDGSSDVDLKCYWMDGNKNRLDFIVPVTRNQPIWFDATTGNGTFQVNPFPKTPANGFDNPFLVGPIAPVQVTAAAAQVTGTDTSLVANASGPNPLTASVLGDFQTFQSGTWNIDNTNTASLQNGVLTRAVTINGVTQNISQDVTITAFGNGAVFLSVNSAPEVIFDLPDGRQIGFLPVATEDFLDTTGSFPEGFQAFVRIINPEAGDTAGPTGEGLLTCWAVDPGATQQVKWNHLSGTATVYHPDEGAYEYSAYTFFAPTGVDLQPVGAPGALNLNGVEYDSCPLYLIGQFTPEDTFPLPDAFPEVDRNRLVVAGCTLDLRQDWTPVFTKLQFDVWNEDEVKFTGAFECADSWHVTDFVNDFDAASQNFQPDTLGTPVARYRVQGVKSSQCPDAQAVGLLGVQSTRIGAGFQIFNGCEGECEPEFKAIGTPLATAGKFNGKIVWDPAGSVPEGGIR